MNRIVKRKNVYKRLLDSLENTVNKLENSLSHVQKQKEHEKEIALTKETWESEEHVTLNFVDKE